MIKIIIQVQVTFCGMLHLRFRQHQPICAKEESPTHCPLLFLFVIVDDLRV